MTKKKTIDLGVKKFEFLKNDPRTQVTPFDEFDAEKYFSLQNSTL